MHEELAARKSQALTTGCVGGIPITAISLSEAVLEVVMAARDRKDPLTVRFINAYSIAVSSRDAEYFELLRGEGINFPDGAPVAWALRRKMGSNAEQVRGPSFFVSAIEAGAELGLRNYFFGTSDSTLEFLRANILSRHPDAIIAGQMAPPYGSVNEILTEDVVATMRDAKPDVVWVGLGSPKQDYVTRILADQLQVPCIGVGAAFDFVAGTVAESPALVQRLGLEWAFRLLSEPRRLWKRYFFGNSRFLAVLASEAIGLKRGPV